VSEWRETTLGECFDLSKAKIGPNDVHAGVPYVGMEHLDPGSPRVARWGSPADVTSLVSQFESGDVLFGRLRPYLRKVALADQHGVCSPEILVLRPTEATVPGFTYLLASSDGCIEHAVAQSAGSRMPRASATDLAAHPISVPPLDEQRQIVDVVAAVDAQIEVLEAEVSSANAVARLATQNPDATTAPLGLRVRARGGKRMPKGKQFADGATSHPYLRVVDMSGLGFDHRNLEFVPDQVWPSISRYTVKAGEVVVSIVGTIGRVALVPEWANGANLTENAAVIDVLDDDLDPEWLATWLSSPTGQREIDRVTVGTSQGKLALSRISLIEVPGISTDEQRARALSSRSAFEVASHLDRELATLRAMRSALLTALLSQSISIPESYDALLNANLSAVEGAPA